MLHVDGDVIDLDGVSNSRDTDAEALERDQTVQRHRSLPLKDHFDERENVGSRLLIDRVTDLVQCDLRQTAKVIEQEGAVELFGR